MKMVKLSNYFEKNLRCTFIQMLNEEKEEEKNFNSWGNKKLGCKYIYSLENLSGREKKIL